MSGGYLVATYQVSRSSQVYLPSGYLSSQVYLPSGYLSSQVDFIQVASSPLEEPGGYWRLACEEAPHARRTVTPRDSQWIVVAGLDLLIKEWFKECCGSLRSWRLWWSVILGGAGYRVLGGAGRRRSRCSSNELSGGCCMGCCGRDEISTALLAGMRMGCKSGCFHGCFKGTGYRVQGKSGCFHGCFKVCMGGAPCMCIGWPWCAVGYGRGM